MNVTDEGRLQRIADCRELYLKYEGGSHELIEREMRAKGHTDFHRRSMYRRFERGRCREGWIGQFCWQGMVDREKRRRRDERGGRRDEGGGMRDEEDSPPDSSLILHHSS